MRDFNPANTLLKNDSTKDLAKRHADLLHKQHMLHEEARERNLQRGKEVRYTIPSNQTKDINSNYREMQGEIQNMAKGLDKKVRKDEEAFMEEFTERLRKLHARYRELEKKNRELSSFTKLSDDIDALIAERDELNAECAAIDARIREN